MDTNISALHLYAPLMAAMDPPSPLNEQLRVLRVNIHLYEIVLRSIRRKVLLVLREKRELAQQAQEQAQEGAVAGESEEHEDLEGEGGTERERELKEEVIELQQKTMFYGRTWERLKKNEEEILEMIERLGGGETQSRQAAVGSASRTGEPVGQS